jgi:low temperature requirement protein LtrA
MVGRSPDEEHRRASPLELLFDLTFVVAVSKIAGQFAHSVAAGEAVHEIVPFLQVFFAIWWAWMNFTWFASSYDTDDVPYRLLTFVQMAGVLVLAAGVPRAFEHRDFDIVLAGYFVMRAALATLWLRAAHHDVARRGTDRRYAVGVSLCLIGWAGVGALGWPVWAFVAMGAVELLVPMWAEAVESTTWHPEHIAERYGLFTIIVLGETILSSSVAFQAVVDARNVDLSAVLTAIGALLTVFAMWWIYFAKPAAPRLSNRIAFRWGYGHYVVFASAAAVGAGVGVMVDRVTDRTHLSDVAAAAAFTVPVIFFLLAVAFIQMLLYGVHRDRLGAVVVALVLVAGATFTGQPVLVSGLVLAALVAVLVLLADRSAPVHD